MTSRISPAKAWWLSLSFGSALGLYALRRVFAEGWLPAQGLTDRAGDMVGRDFINIWAAARLALAGKADTLYDAGAYRDYIQANFSPHEYNFLYPPHILLFIFFFGTLHYLPALILWSAGGIAAAVAALRQALGEKRLWPAFLLALSPASVVNLMSGQNGFFTAALFLGGLAFSEANPALAGIFFGVLTVKPQMGLLVPVILLLREDWKCFAAAAATGITLALASLAVYGAFPWLHYPEKLSYGYSLLTDFQGMYTEMLPGPFAEARAAGLDMQVSAWLYGASAMVAIVLTLLVCRREGPASPRALLSAAIAAILVTPYGYNYDCVVISAALLAYAGREEREFLPLEFLMGALLWLLPAILFPLRENHLPLSPFILLGALACFALPQAGRLGQAQLQKLAEKRAK